MPDFRTSLLVLAVLLWAVVQYGLVAWALRDLVRRRQVRGGNKVVWGLLILAVPVLGALAYSVVAPVEPLARPSRLVAPPRRLIAHDDTAA
ncbi:MAG: PLD nuclease N-terminal domain-containing protein [Thermomicrobiales bacterium]